MITDDGPSNMTSHVFTDHPLTEINGVTGGYRYVRQELPWAPHAGIKLEARGTRLPMCHLILLLPVLALPIFWVAPLSVAVPAYAAVVALSVWTYVLIMRSMHRPLESGVEKLEHDEGEVIETSGKRAMVRVESEIWQARCDEELRRGDRVRVLAVEGLTLRVARVQPPSHSSGGGRNAPGSHEKMPAA